MQISAIGDIPAETQRDILQKHGMRVCVTHKSLDLFRNDLPGLIEHHKIIGCDAPGLGSAPEEFRGSKANVREFIRIAGEIGKELKKHGMTFNYHNHDFEFQPLEDGKTMMDMLLEETDPESFRFIPDLMWIHYAGADPVQVLERMRGRVKVVHFKDYVRTENGKRFTVLGQGVTPLEACWDACRRLEIPYVVYEQDSDWIGNDPFASCEPSWAYLQALEAKEG